MHIFSTSNTAMASPPKERANERGAALLTVLLFSGLVLAAAGTLIMTTSLSATNAIDATAESQAYYAAEAGLQATLAVLRGNVAPNPLFDTSSASAAANKISFRKAVSPAFSNAYGDAATYSNRTRLSRWLTYNSLADNSRVELSSPYSPLSGMAYDSKVDDPDNTANSTYSTLGSFGSDTPSPSPIFYQFNMSGGSKVTVSYDPRASTAISAAGTTLGSFRLSLLTGTPDISTDPKHNFVITVRQVSSSATLDVAVKVSLAVSGGNVVATFQAPSPTSNNISGTTYVHAASITFGTTSVPVPVTITPPEPRRVRITVNGYGPHGAKKQMHMMVSRFSFDFVPNAAITIRSAEPTPGGVQMTSFSVGSSSPYGFSGFDNAGGSNLPAFVVTNNADLNLVNTTITGQPVTGTPTPARKAGLSELPAFLQTVQGARDAVDALRESAKLQYWPLYTDGTPNGPNNDRYFPAGTTPSSFGSVSTPLTTFVDGDCALPPGGGAGLLIVTGVLDMRGSADFKGLVLVLGAGQVLRNGGGSDSTLGSMDIARFGPTGDFLPPSFDSNGSGASQLDYDSKWLEKALMTTSPGVRGVSEY